MRRERGKFSGAWYPRSAKPYCHLNCDCHQPESDNYIHPESDRSEEYSIHELDDSFASPSNDDSQGGFSYEVGSSCPRCHVGKIIIKRKNSPKAPQFLACNRFNAGRGCGWLGGGREIDRIYRGVGGQTYAKNVSPDKDGTYFSLQFIVYSVSN